MSTAEGGCGKNQLDAVQVREVGVYYLEGAVAVILLGTPEKIFNLMFTSGFI